VPKPPTAKSAARAAAVDLEAQTQLERFEQAMAAFHARDLKRAAELFALVAQGPAREVALAARSHREMCERRLSRQTPKLETADDHYHYGVALINQRRIADGVAHLRKSLELQPTAHAHYALSVAHALERRFDDSAQHLAESIRLDPSVRITARNDPDLADFLQEPALRAVLHSDRNT